MPTTASAPRYGASTSAPSGTTGSAMRTRPYVPILSSTPASSTDPTVGAAVWASGSQVCSGHIGVLTAKPSAEREERQHLHAAATCPRRRRSASSTMSKVPASAPTSRMPSSITTLPSSV